MSAIFSAGSPKKCAALLLQNQQRALDGADRRLGHIAVAGADLVGALGDVGEQRLQVLHVEKQQAFLVGDAEGDVDDALLRLGEVHQPRQKQRPHFGDRRPDRMALLAEQIPEDHRKFLELVRIELDRLGARDQEILGLAHHGDAGQVALDVGAEDRNALVGEAFGQDLQRHGLAGAGRAGHQAVAVAVFQQQFFRLLVAVVGLAAGADKDARFVSHASRLRCSCA